MIDENIKKLVDLAIACGRKRLSIQTGFVHHYYHSSDGDVQHSIPIVENVLFALALFRSHISENVLEAKGILERVLAFQNLNEEDVKGNFPIYLHEYPQCKDRLLGAQLLTPLYWILCKYQQVLGAQLSKKLENAVYLLLRYCLKIHEEKPVPYYLGIKIAIAAEAFGLLFEDSGLENRGKALVESYLKSSNSQSWLVSSQLGEICSALQMLYPSLSKSPWQHFWKHLAETWHLESCAYVGPAFKEFQAQSEPQPTLYDCYLGYFSGTFPQRIFADRPFHLQASLIQQTADRLPALSYPVILEGKDGNCSWKLFQHERYAYTVITKEVQMDPANEKGFYPFRVIWGSSKKTHSFGCQGGNLSQISFKQTDRGIEMLVLFGETTKTEEREKNRELAFYFDRQEGTVIRVEGDSSTTFQVDEKVDIIMDHLHCSLVFQIEEGEGQFFGHIMPGNRLAQLSLKGVERYNAYDWQLFLRTLKRSEVSKIRLKIGLDLI